MNLQTMTDDQLAIMITALEQFVDNQPERDEWEAEPADETLARSMMDAAEFERLQRLVAETCDCCGGSGRHAHMRHLVCGVCGGSGAV